MKGHLALFAFGVGLAVAGTYTWEAIRRRESGATEHEDLGEHGRKQARQIVSSLRRSKRAVNAVDLNSASADQLRDLGLAPEFIDRVIEHRPYRNKLDLVSQMVLPADVYERIKSQVRVARDNAGVKVA